MLGRKFPLLVYRQTWHSATRMPLSSAPSSTDGNPPNHPPAQMLWQQMSGYRGLYLAAILAMFTQTLISFVTPLLASATIDYALSFEPREGSLPAQIVGYMGGAEFVRNNLWVPALLMLAFTVLAGVFNYLKGRWAAKASEGIARRLKDRLYDHLQRLPVRTHDRADSGDIIQRCTSDVETLRLALASQVVEVSNALILLLTALPIMLLLDMRMTAVSFALIGPIILYGYFYFNKVRSIFREVEVAEGQVTHLVQENLSGLRVVRAFARQEYEINKFAGPNKLYRDRSLKLLRLMANYWATSDLIVLSQQGLVLFAGIYFISTGSLTVGTLFAFMMFLNMLLWPVRQMGRILTDFGKSTVAMSRIGEILSEQDESMPTTPKQFPERCHGKIEVTDLHFAHSKDIAAIQGIEFSVEAGETLAIVGPSGSGKSTLMHLLLRLYDYEQGSIRLDGMELSELDRSWVRAQFSVVLQEPFLFSKTIGDNIRFGQLNAATDQIAEAARMAHIHDTILNFPQGYQTLVGERGVTLSGGQRQRVALARALLREAPVLLLDDALSAVDAETESTILDALRERHGRRTTLVIAHRLSTLAQADRVIVLEEGRITQQGIHEDLIRTPGLYQRLWTIQSQEAL